ncbi:TonB-dependent copper receptor, partial [Pseudomonas salmasensis]|nr:TonB-dependent copper receptor [Pseudomonas salmasensis]
MSRFSADTRLGSTALLTALCGALLAAHAHADEHELSPTVITAIAPSSPLTVVTNPKDPRQPVPASDGGDYLKT